MESREPINILLVDDNPAKLLSYQAILSDLGENLIKASSGSEALDCLLKNRIALVLVDVCMPDLDGFELTSMIRNHPRFQKTAIILVSGFMTEDVDRLKGYVSGAVDYVSVPIVPEILRAKVSVFTDLFRKTDALERLNEELNQRTEALSVDITERKRTEEQLRSLTERLSLATQSAAIGIWDWDLGSNHIIWDDIVFATFGIPKASSVAYEEFARRVHPDDLSAVEASLQRSIRDKTQDFMEFRVIRPDGEMRHISGAMGVILDDHGTVVRLVGTCADITERKRMEAEIEANKEQLVTSARLSALGMMAGGIAHEINNPLGVIQASAENILRMTESGSVQIPVILKNCDRIIVTAGRISTIVRGLRHIAREGSADEFRDTAVREIVDDTLELCSERFRAHNIRLDVASVDPQAVIKCREVQICQVLLNLLQNAFDELVNREGDRWVKLDVTSCPPWVAISVSDSGQGIAPENRSHIMEPFFTTKPVGQGTGLGLGISRSIVLEHKGTLELDQSSPHTCFVMKLPLSGGT